jgi:hypothetical protein
LVSTSPNSLQTDKLKHPLASIPSCEGSMFPSLLSLHTYNIVFIVKITRRANPVVIILILFLCVPVTPHASFPRLVQEKVISPALATD